MSTALQEGDVVYSCKIIRRFSGSLNSIIYLADFNPDAAEHRLKKEFRLESDAGRKQCIKERINHLRTFKPATTFLKQFNNPGFKSKWLYDFVKYQNEIHARINAVDGSGTLYCRELDSFVCDERGKRAYYQAQEYLAESRTLTDLLAQGRPDVKELVTHGKKMLYALEKLHEKGVIHADMKPDNVLIITNQPDEGPPTELRIIDFDSSLLKGKKTPREEEHLQGKPNEKFFHRGTPRYWSPEHFTGVTPDTYSDVFTAAIILCEMLSPDGHPFPEDKDEYKKAIQHGKVNFSQLKCKVPTDVIKTIRACLDFLPGNRPTLSSLREALLLI